MSYGFPSIHDTISPHLQEYIVLGDYQEKGQANLAQYLEANKQNIANLSPANQLAFASSLVGNSETVFARPFRVRDGLRPNNKLSRAMAIALCEYFAHIFPDMKFRFVPTQSVQEDNRPRAYVAKSEIEKKWARMMPLSRGVGAAALRGTMLPA